MNKQERINKLITESIQSVEPLFEAEKTEGEKAFESLNETLLDLRNAQTKLLTGVGANLQSLYKTQLESIVKQIKGTETLIENLIKDMHARLGK